MRKDGVDADILTPGDGPVFELLNSTALHPILITGDHAGNAVPARLGDLGLGPAEFERHIAWDIGVVDLARRLAARLQATAVIARYSRLVVDLNRPLGDPGLIPAASDGTPVPGNQSLAHSDILRRVDGLYWPYHRAIDVEIARLQRSGCVPLLLALHSFTPALRVGAALRPWHVGVLYGQDQRFAQFLIGALAARGDLMVGANEPYSGVTHGYGLKVHGIAHGLPHAELEIRQDLIATLEGRQHWADLLAGVLADVVKCADLTRLEFY